MLFFSGSAEDVSLKPPSLIKCEDSISSISQQSSLVDLITFSENQAKEVPVTFKDHCLSSDCLH